MTTSCPCKGIPPANPEVIGFQRDLHDRIIGVMWNCPQRGSSHILPLRSALCTHSMKLKAWEMDRLVIT